VTKGCPALELSAGIEVGKIMEVPRVNQPSA
jgi:hypothetical protein